MRGTLIAGVLVAIAGVVLGCGGNGSRAAPTPAASCRTGTYRVAVNRGGERRTALVHVPRRASGPAPLYLVLHFAGGTGALMQRASGMSELADRRGFVAAYPDALPRSRPFWNVTAAGSKPDDVGFASALIALLVQRGCADASRVYATGVSNGASMSYLLACRLGDDLAGFAPVAGSYIAGMPCNPSRPLSVLEIHGTGDTVAPYGGRPGRTMSVPEFLNAWRVHDACPEKGRRRSLARVRATRFDWAPCGDRTAVAHIRLTGAGHGLPPNPPIQGRRSNLDASRAIVDFLSP